MTQFGGFGGFQAPAPGGFGGAAGSCDRKGCRRSSRCIELICLTTLATFSLPAGGGFGGGFGVTVSYFSAPPFRTEALRLKLRGPHVSISPPFDGTKSACRWIQRRHRGWGLWGRPRSCFFWHCPSGRRRWRRPRSRGFWGHRNGWRFRRRPSSRGLWGFSRCGRWL